MSDVADEVRALETMGLEGLRSVWRGRWGAPPPLRSVDLLRHIIAWRIQAAAYGGLDAGTRRLLRVPTPKPRGPKVAAGMRIAREWKGVRHEVEVVEAGYRYEGKAYSSLSEIARFITGARWNGPRFFGLRGTANP